MWSICSQSSCVACIGHTRWCVSAGCAPQDPWVGSLPRGGGSGMGRTVKACQEDEFQSYRCAVLYFESVQSTMQVLLLLYGSSRQYLLLCCRSMAVKDSQPCFPDVLPCNTLLCCAVLCCAVLCCAVLCCAVLCCAVLCCAVLCCAALRCVLPCCAVLCCRARSQVFRVFACFCRAD